MAAAEVSEYEAARNRNIEANHAKLRELNLEGGMGAAMGIDKITPRRPPPKKRKPRNWDAPAPKARARTRRARRAARKAGDYVSDDELGNVSLDEDVESSEDEEVVQMDLDMSSLVAKLKTAGKIGGKVATKEEIAGAREAFKQRYMKIKGGTYKEWAIDRTIKEGGRADYDAKKFARQHFGSLNKEARLKPGHIPHMAVNTEFYSRAEMEAVGFHGKQMNGIDYCSANHSKYEVDGVPMPYALTVISAGGYEDDVEGPDGSWLWYTGEGGNDLNSSRRQVASQKMKGGNEALLNSHKLGLPVRLARFIGKTQEDTYTGIKYIYDGLYDVKAVKQGKGTQGKGVIQFLLQRQVNAENGKLRPNANPPRHERILQLGARDGSTAKFEASAKLQREEAKRELGIDHEGVDKAAGAKEPAEAKESEQKTEKAAASVPSKRVRAAPKVPKAPKSAVATAAQQTPLPALGALVSVTFKGMGDFDGEVCETDKKSGKFRVHFQAAKGYEASEEWISTENVWKLLPK